MNLNWRQDGYAIAYEDGVYGYVDAGYIKTQVANNDPNRKNVIKNKYKGLIGKKDEHYLYGKGIIISQDQAKPEKGQGAFCQL